MRKRLNYGILKSNIEIDSKRFNLDYLAGIITTDGNLRKYTTCDYYRGLISQDHPKYLMAIKDYLEKKGYKCNVDLKAKQVYFDNKKLVKYFMSYTFDKSQDKKSFIAGVIDGDGSFCSHKSSSGEYWRFQIAAKKQRKVKLFKEIMEWLSLGYTTRIAKDGKSVFTIAKSEDLLQLINLIELKVIIKKDVLKLIYPQIIQFQKNKYKTCKYCNKQFLYFYSKAKVKVYHCKNISCVRKYNAERMRRLRAIWKRKLNK